MEIPVMLNVAERHCLVVGGGRAGLRKAGLLARSNANVTILSPSLRGTLPPNVAHVSEAYSTDKLVALRPWLVAAATDSTTTNQQIQSDAGQAGILVMRLDEPKAGDLYGIMFRQLGDILLAVSSGSPLFSRELLDLLESQITPAQVTYAGWLKKLRSAGKSRVPDPEDRIALWKRIAASDVLERLQNGDDSGARAELVSIVGDDLARGLK